MCVCVCAHQCRRSETHITQFNSTSQLCALDSSSSFYVHFPPRTNEFAKSMQKRLCPYVKKSRPCTKFATETNRTTNRRSVNTTAMNFIFISELNAIYSNWGVCLKWRTHAVINKESSGCGLCTASATLFRMAMCLSLQFESFGCTRNRCRVLTAYTSEHVVLHSTYLRFASLMYIA